MRTGHSPPPPHDHSNLPSSRAGRAQLRGSTAACDHRAVRRRRRRGQRQRVAPPRPAPVGPATRVERAHRLTCLARMPADATVDSIDDGLWSPGSATAFETWVHAACLIPVEDWPLLRLARERARSRANQPSDTAYTDVLATVADSPNGVTIREIEHARPIPRTSRPPTRPQPLRSNHNLRRARNPSHRTDISSRRSPRHPGRPAAPTVVAAERRRLDQSLAKRCPHNVLAIPTTALTLLLTHPTGLRGLSDDQCN